MTDWSTVLVILVIWPFEMLGTAYIVTFLLTRQLKKIWASKEKEKKKWWNPLG